MTGAEILAGFASIGARVVLTPAGVVDVDAPAVPELELLVAAVKANRAEVVEELRRGPRRVTVADEERAARKCAVLAERYCPACGFSFWRVTSRGDASCYGCDLLRAGRALVCAACGRSDWRRDEHGHAVCASCATGGQSPAPVEIVLPGATSGAVFEQEGAA